MSKTRKVLATLAAALALVLAMVGAAFAPRVALADDTPTYTIEISKTVSGATYSAYKVFDVVYEGENYAYTIDSSNPFLSTVQGSPYFTLEKLDASTYSVSLADGASDRLANFAAALKTAYDGFTDAQKTQYLVTSGQSTATDSTITLTVNEPGYYFVTTTAGTLCSLDTTNDTAEVWDKNQTPEIDKRVLEAEHLTNGDHGYVKQNDANIGDVVTFRIEVIITKNTVNYVIHDTLSAGLTLDANSFRFGVNADGTGAEPKNNVPDDYTGGITIKTGDEVSDSSYTFEIALDNAMHSTFLGDDPSKSLYIFYEATLNERANVGAAGNENTATLTYGTGSGVTTDPVTTKTYAWDLDVVKYTGDDTTTRLSGAQFRLYRCDENWNKTSDDPLTFLKSTIITDKPTYNVSTADGATSIITTDEGGEFVFRGLDSGYYLLEEVEAPTGYNKLANPIHVTIGVTYDMNSSPMWMLPNYTFDKAATAPASNSGTVAPTEATADSTVYVQNNSSKELPRTGGMGTTLLYVVGGVMVVVAGGLLVARRRTRA